jgi:hypothetical protein
MNTATVTPLSYYTIEIKANTFIRNDLNTSDTLQITLIGGSPVDHPEQTDVPAKIGDSVLAFIRSTGMAWNDEDGLREILQLNNVPGNALLVRQQDGLYHPVYDIDEPISIDMVRQMVLSQP